MDDQTRLRIVQSYDKRVKTTVGEAQTWDGKSCMGLSDRTGRGIVVYFPEVLGDQIQKTVREVVVTYARYKFLEMSDHTGGEYPSPERYEGWEETFPLGGCVYLSRSQHAQGHENREPQPSASLVGGSNKFRQGMLLLDQLSPVAETANYLIRTVDKKVHDQMKEVRTAMIKARPDVKGICAVDPGLHTTIGIIVNRRSGKHKDKKDAPDSWAVMFSFGCFRGGDLEFPGEKVTVPFRPGDAVLLRAMDVEHAVKEWSGSLRITLVYFTKSSVWRLFAAS